MKDGAEVVAFNPSGARLERRQHRRELRHRKQQTRRAGERGGFKTAQYGGKYDQREEQIGYRIDRATLVNHQRDDRSGEPVAIQIDEGEHPWRVKEWREHEVADA